MIIDVTSTNNINRRSISDANTKIMHNKHDPNHKHSNEDINFDESYMNYHRKFNERDDVLEEHYGSFVEQQREKAQKRLASGKCSVREYYERSSKNVSEFLRKSKQHKLPIVTIVSTLGNVDTTFDILDKLNFDYEKVPVYDNDGSLTHYRPHLTDPDQIKVWSDMWNKGYERYTEILNKSGGFKVTDMTTHLDEGTPHVHIETVPLGVSKNGKPLTALDKAFAKIDGLPTGGGRTQIKAFREKFDHCLADEMTKSFKEHGFDVDFNVIRLGGKHGLSMEEYKAKKGLESQVKNAREALTSAYKTFYGTSSTDTPKDLKKLSEGIISAVGRHKEEMDDLKQDYAEQVNINESLRDANDKLVTKHVELEEDYADKMKEIRRLKRKRNAYADVNAEMVSTLNDLNNGTRQSFVKFIVNNKDSFLQALNNFSQSRKAPVERINDFVDDVLHGVNKKYYAKLDQADKDNDLSL